MSAYAGQPTTQETAFAEQDRCCICGWRLGPDAPEGQRCSDPCAGLDNAVPYDICRFCSDVRRGQP